MTNTIWKNKSIQPAKNAWIITKWDDDGEINYEMGRGADVIHGGYLKASNCLGWRYAFEKTKLLEKYERVLRRCRKWIRGYSVCGTEAHARKDNLLKEIDELLADNKIRAKG